LVQLTGFLNTPNLFTLKNMYENISIKKYLSSLNSMLNDFSQFIYLSTEF
jgi:hypothetical protein